jgi:AraC family transcriptional activator of pyochelin receptor
MNAPTLDLGAVMGSAETWRTFDLEASMDDQTRSVVTRLERMSDAAHYRVGVANEWAAGSAEVCLMDGTIIQTMDVKVERSYAEQVTSPDIVRIQLADQHCGEFSPPYGDPISANGPGAMIVIEPAGQPPTNAVIHGRIRMAQVGADRSSLRRLYGTGNTELPAVMQRFLDGSLRQTAAHWLPLTPSLMRCLDDLQGCTQRGTTRRLYMQSKAIEIFCLAFDLLNEDKAPGRLDTSAVTRRGVLKAQQILMERFASPPSLDSLAQEVGVSRTRLIAGFREIAGQSVFDYIHHLRMEQALVLLNQDGASITEVAYALGYNHPSSFTVAVQRRFGVSPRALRKAHA